MAHRSAATAAAASTADAELSAAAEAFVSDDDDDCPPLALAAGLVNYSDASGKLTATAAEAAVAVAVAAPAATVTAAGDGCSSDHASSVAASTAQQQHKPSMQQPCAQCGKLTKKRCRRCRAVYYCSEQCQIECFKDPEHRAACEAAAAAEQLHR
eukprot:2105-Heterococcus_DN1.PRE.2